MVMNKKHCVASLSFKNELISEALFGGVLPAQTHPGSSLRNRFVCGYREPNRSRRLTLRVGIPLRNLPRPIRTRACKRSHKATYSRMATTFSNVLQTVRPFGGLMPNAM